jgi:glycosyltransferase involved in cell wall biosynthesis
VQTGIDKVELAYLQAFVADDVPCFAIARTALGYVVLDRAGMSILIDHVKYGNWPRIDLISRLNRRLKVSAKRGQSTLRRLAIARCLPRNLGKMLGALSPQLTYVNVGHSNLTEHMLGAVRRQANSRIVVLLHDTIPLDWPQFQRADTVAAFDAKLRRVAAYADQVICTSAQCLRDARRHLEARGRVPQMIPAALGIELASSAQVELPQTPYFLCVGTIEPRKNHALLLDIWDDPPADARLVIVGRRGWENDAIFERLDKKPDKVIEHNNLTDGQIVTLVQNAQGSLFPSFAEGFGLPPIEAAALGTPVICADLPSCREILGASAVYLDPTDRYQWKKQIEQLAKTARSPTKPDFVPPDWDTHFKIVFTVM